MEIHWMVILTTVVAVAIFGWSAYSLITAKK